jgi:hypothetical protein
MHHAAAASDTSPGRRGRLGRRFIPVALVVAAAGSGAAGEDADLQKKLANPIADLVTLPFQWTTTAGVGPLERPQHTLLVQPVGRASP